MSGVRVGERCKIARRERDPDDGPGTEWEAAIFYPDGTWKGSCIYDTGAEALQALQSRRSDQPEGELPGAEGK